MGGPCCSSRPLGGAPASVSLLRLWCCSFGLLTAAAAAAEGPAAALGLLPAASDWRLSAALSQKAQQTQEGDEEICTQNFRDAFNAAVSHVIGSRKLTEHLLPLWGQTEAYVPLLVCGPALPGEEEAAPSSSQWPEKEALLEDDLLQQILERGYVTVAGLAQGRVGSLSRPYKGAGGDYTADPPIGFFPDYLRQLLKTIGRKYNVTLTAKYLFFRDVETAQAAVAAGLADMTDIYFLLSHGNKQLASERLGGLSLNTANPLSFLYMTCPVVGSAVYMYTKDNQVPSFEDLVSRLFKAIRLEKPEAKATVIVFSRELKAAIDPVLPTGTILLVEEQATKALKAVAEGKAVAAFFVGSTPPAALPREVTLNTGVSLILAKGAWIRRSLTTKCLKREHAADLFGAGTQPAS
ncbi:hypothetical protein Efla_002566 [Eimeria flavescens]